MAYYYEHTDGYVIRKPDLVVDMGGGPFAYFSGPFVRSWWQESDLLQPIKPSRQDQEVK